MSRLAMRPLLVSLGILRKASVLTGCACSQVVADIAKTLGLSRESVSVGHSHASHEGLHVDIVLRSNRGGGGRGPQCGVLAAELVKQAGELGSTLRAMPATRRAVAAVIREVNAPVTAVAGSVSAYASLRGGERGTRPGLTGVGGQGEGEWSYDPRGVKALSRALSQQETEMQRARVAASAKRERDGFWVDVEDGRQRVQSVGVVPVQHTAMRPTAGYGAVVVPDKDRRMPAWLRTLGLMAAAAFTLMVVWVVYLKYYYGKI